MLKICCPPSMLSTLWCGDIYPHSLQLTEEEEMAPVLTQEEEMAPMLTPKYNASDN